MKEPLGMANGPPHAAERRERAADFFKRHSGRRGRLFPARS